MVLASIRKISGKKKLQKLKVKSASPLPFAKITSIGIIYYLEDDKELKNLQKIQKALFLVDKKVEILCWLKSTNKKPHPLVEGIQFIDRGDFDSNFLPNSKKTRYFCDQDFDLLLDLTTNYHFPTHAMAVMSNAKLKSGMDHKLNWHLQVRIKLEESKKSHPTYLFDQIIIYLEQLF
jgi:hypothetical protein